MANTARRNMHAQLITILKEAEAAKSAADDPAAWDHCAHILSKGGACEDPDRRRRLRPFEGGSRLREDHEVAGPLLNPGQCRLHVAFSMRLNDHATAPGAGLEPGSPPRRLQSGHQPPTHG